MSRVKNRAVIRRIADRTRNANRGKSIVAVLAIALTAMMFTVVITVGGSMMKKTQEERMRQVGGSAHAGYKYLTQKEYEHIKKDKWIKSISYRITVGDLINKEVAKLPTEVNCFEPLDAKWSFCYPEKGHMPEHEDEIVTSDLVLRALGVKCEIGERVPLEIEIGDKKVKREFTLCGYYKGDVIAMSQILLVSRAFQEKYAPVQTKSSLNRELAEGEYTGWIMADFNYYTSIGLKQQTRALSKRLGYPQDTNIGINWAYMGEDVDVTNIVPVCVLLLVILLSGYLIIYNIFYISVSQDIAHYGLLKTVGTTGRQLKMIVRRQAYILSLYGIPLGIILGVLIAETILPVIMKNFRTAAIITDKVVLNGWILAGAALFSFVTVYISCIKPCRVASRVTAIEAVHYTEGQGEKKTRRSRRHKKTKHVTPLALAGQNVRRSRKRVVIVVSSLSLALVVLNCVSGFVNGFNMDSFLKDMVVCDYSVSDAFLDNATANFELQMGAITGVPEEFSEELRQKKGISEVSNVYAKEIAAGLTDEEWSLVEKRAFDNPIVQENIKMYAPTEEEPEEYLEWMKKNREVETTIYGMGQIPVEKLTDVKGDLSWEKFRTGKYVIARRINISDEEQLHMFEPGEKVHLSNEKGDTREYEVLAVASIPYPVAKQWFGVLDCDFILPDEEYLDFMGKSKAMRTMFNVEEGYEEEIGEWIEEYCTVDNPDLDYNSKEKVEEEFKSYMDMFSLLGNLLVVILACIGILNFVNTMVTSILSRRQELAMMEAVGMTSGQLRQMLMMEGGYYACYTAVIALVLGTFFNIFLLDSVAASFIGFAWKSHFSLTSILVCIPFIVLVVLLVPVICFGRVHSASVVERIKRAE